MTTHLSSAQTNHQICNESILSLPRAMANHHTPTALLRHLTAVNEKNLFSRPPVVPHVWGTVLSCDQSGKLFAHKLALAYSCTDIANKALWSWTLYILMVTHFWVPETWPYALMDSVTVPIWLTFSSRQLQAFTSTALLIRLGLVTVRSSPTTWMSVLPVKFVQAVQSSWSKGSSMETTGRKKKDENAAG